MFAPNKKVRLSQDNEANIKEQVSDGKLNCSKRTVIHNEEKNGQTREEVLVESLNKMKDENKKYLKLVQVTKELQRILKEDYGFLGRPNFVANKIIRNPEYKNFINSHILEGKYNHITIYQFTLTILYIR